MLLLVLFSPAWFYFVPVVFGVNDIPPANDFIFKIKNSTEPSEISYRKLLRDPTGRQNPLLPYSNKPWCPSWIYIAPCECGGSQGFPILTCKELAHFHDLHRIFSSWFPVTDFGKLSLTNSDISTLSKGIFGNIRFEYIYVYKTTLKKVEKGAFGQSNESLKRIEIIHNDLETFPFQDLQHFLKLGYLQLKYNGIKRIPDFAFGYVPELKKIDLSFNKIFHIGSYAFKDLPCLEQLDLRFNKLAVLNNHAFHLSKPNNLLNLDISNNKIILIANEAFHNQVPKVLNISKNNLKKLKDTEFKPVLLNMIDKNDGVLVVNDNRFLCTCVNVKWLLRLRERIRRHVKGYFCSDLKKPLFEITLNEIECY
ncbi:oplophorus-luciferin 2-monooxygenase non-catalytic subunit-like [Limulus polyphemus]|uniref:Oplophorus-luciferin 2-monooxygenase non-catalytic subunit-like n=1 Tax=Limulus polyphemus TaxID=6850 RepID=A0ABM1BBK6_LIMPO|nr:oplophorus-luciferin 2-monooxygenase non-catalytic subunit-like [Limulus polyphemus]XP_022246401.1 oplophorus-luciferin 2-monooxygenase non-catalytic subunit-like [Limulus polyphemus]